MRVLLTADTVGGVWTYALQLARALDRAGVTIDLATMGAPLSPAQRCDALAARNVTLHESTFRLEWMQEPWDDVAHAGEWLLGLERTLRPDVVHLNGYAHGALPWSAPVLVVAHSCVLSWWRAVRAEPAPIGWARYHAAVTLGLNGADAIVAPTAAMLRMLREHYRFGTPAHVVPNGLAATPVARTARAEERVVLAAGRLWDEAKNIGALAAAAPSIQWPVYVAGSAAHPEGGRRVPAGLHALGLLDAATMRTWYARADIFVHPALYEPFGLAPLEAALAGCALVLGDIPTLREVWGDAAVYVPPRDPHALAAAVNALGTDDDALRRRARAAQRCARGFTATRMADSYRELYRRLAAGTVDGEREVLACAS